MARTESTMLELGKKAPDFKLKNIDDKFYSLTDFRGKPLLIMFLCNHCPFVKHIRNKISEIGNEYQEKGMGVIAISSNDEMEYPQDGPEQMKLEAEDAGYQFPYLFDPTQEIAKAYRAACTPDFYLFDAKHTLVYRGQLDDSRPGNAAPIDGKDLINAIEAIIKGEQISQSQKPSMGCNIKWKKGNEPNYYGK